MQPPRTKNPPAAGQGCEGIETRNPNDQEGERVEMKRTPMIPDSTEGRSPRRPLLPDFAALRAAAARMQPEYAERVDVDGVLEGDTIAFESALNCIHFLDCQADANDWTVEPGTIDTRRAALGPAEVEIFTAELQLLGSIAAFLDSCEDRDIAVKYVRALCDPDVTYTVDPIVGAARLVGRWLVQHVPHPAVADEGDRRRLVTLTVLGTLFGFDADEARELAAALERTAAAVERAEGRALRRPVDFCAEPAQNGVGGGL